MSEMEVQHEGVLQQLQEELDSVNVHHSTLRKEYNDLQETNCNLKSDYEKLQVSVSELSASIKDQTDRHIIEINQFKNEYD